MLVQVCVSLCFGPGLSAGNLALLSVFSYAPSMFKCVCVVPVSESKKIKFHAFLESIASNNGQKNNSGGAGEMAQ